MVSDLRIAVRSLFKTPGFTLVAVLTMGIAIAACTALFSVLQAVVLRPLPYPNPSTLVSVWGLNSERNFDASFISWPKYEAYRERQDVFADLGAAAIAGFTLTEGTGEPEQVSGFHATSNFLPILGLNPSLGRHFHADEDRDGGPLVAMISHSLWQNRFSGDPGVLGRVVQLNGVPREIVGILPPAMPPPYANVGILVPRPLDASFINPQNRSTAITFQAIGRLAPGVTVEQANLRVAEMAAHFKAAHPASLDANNTSEVRTITQQVLGNLSRTFWILAGAVTAVLLIACANIANLFLARVSTRQKEIAVRLSLGATRREIIRQFLAETVLFSIVAGGVGVMLAWWSLRGIQLLAGPQLPRANEIALDPGVLLFALCAALLSALIIGLYPALQASRTDVQTVLKDNSRTAGGGRSARTFRHYLVVFQVAGSLTLLICAGLLVLSFQKLQQVDLGFQVEGRAYGMVSLPAARYNTPELTREFYRQLQERLDQAPEIARGGAVSRLPLAGSGPYAPYSIQGRPILPLNERPFSTFRYATAGYLEAMGFRLLEGRFINGDDLFGREDVAVINESFARKLFPGESALGHSFLIGPDAATAVRIVGVIRDVRGDGLAQPPPDKIYYSRDQRGGAGMTVVAQARAGLAADAIIPVLRRVLAELDPNLALAAPQTMERLVTQSIGVQRLTMALLLCFAAIAALLAAVGVYSVMAYAVTQRTGEIGVRMALGASTGNIISLVLRAGAMQVGLGLLLGIVGAFAASRLLATALYDVKPFDPTVFGAVAGFFALVAIVACFIPARRASRVDPMVALRSE
jgi:predicted permease